MANPIIGQLFATMRYLSVADRSGLKLRVDWILPAAMTLVVVTFAALSPKALPFVGERGLLAGVGGLLQALVGFYVAALAAAATFPSAQLVATAQGLTLDGAPVVRRNFICLLFGYLALLSIFVYVSGLLATIPIALVSMLPYEAARTGIAWVLKAVFLFACSQLLTITLLGLYYLAVRIHQAETPAAPNYSTPSPAGGDRPEAPARRHAA